MQETKVQHSGQIILDGNYTYKHIRKNKEGGGVAVSAVKELTPVFVSDGGEKAEAVTVDIHVKDMTLSAISAYGPQESATCEKKLAFRTYLSQEAQRANSIGK